MKHWQQRERAIDLLSKEVGYVRKPHGGKLRVALAFPNTYFVGMSNLGFQTVYKLFNEEADIVCERFFLPPKSELAAQVAAGAPLITLESQTPVREFDVVAFSVSFEWDYTNVLTLLRLAGLPLRAEARTQRHPLVIIGGAVTFVNPEPLALFADEGEAVRLGADQAGALRRMAESIGKHVARQLLDDLKSGATLDRYAADQIIPFAALAEGESRFIIPTVTDHVLTTVWLAELFLGARHRIDGQRLVIHGVGFWPNRECMTG